MRNKFLCVFYHIKSFWMFLEKSNFEKKEEDYFHYWSLFPLPLRVYSLTPKLHFLGRRKWRAGKRDLGRYLNVWYLFLKQLRRYSIIFTFYFNLLNSSFFFKYQSIDCQLVSVWFGMVLSGTSCIWNLPFYLIWKTCQACKTSTSCPILKIQKPFGIICRALSGSHGTKNRP